MLTGAEAAAAASAAGDESPPPNDYYIVNANKALRKLQVKPGISVNVDDQRRRNVGPERPHGHVRRLGRRTSPHPLPRTRVSERLRTGSAVKGGTVVKIKQQYLP